MRVIFCAILMMYFIGCSSYNSSSKNLKVVKKVSHQKAQSHIKNKHIDEISKVSSSTHSKFKYTMSSFAPMSESKEMEEISWETYLKQYEMHIKIVLSIMSIVILMWVIIIGAKYRYKSKKDKKFTI